MIEPSARSYEELRSTFRWNVPHLFNIGIDCCDRQPTRRQALIHVPPDGSVRAYTFGELAEASNRLANALAGVGIERGDRVGIVLPQGPETAIAHIAIYKLGAVALPLSSLFGPDALLYRLSDSSARAAVVDSKALERVEVLRDDLPELKHLLAVDPIPAEDGFVIGFWNALEQASAAFRPVETAADDPALLIYTSGTTGAPKGALHAHRTLLGHLPGFELSHEFLPEPGDRFWTPADWAWIGGLMDALLPSWHHGIPIVSTPRGSFDPEWAFDLMASYEVRNAFLPPTALKLLRQAGGPPKPLGLRTVMSGGEVLGEEMLAWGRSKLGVTVNEIYGQTEANYVIGNCSVAWEIRPGSMGRPYPGHEVAILDENGNTVPNSDVGEIAVRAPDPVMFLEYWNNPRATRDKFRGDWLLTGDTAAQDEGGYLWFRGRKDDVINSAGYRIGPGEVEECLIRHESVAMAAVIGIPDAIRGEVVKAFVKLRSGHAASPELEASIQRHVRERLAAYEYPRVIEFVEELPMTTTGKIRRAELRRVERERAQSSATSGPSGT